MKSLGVLKKNWEVLEISSLIGSMWICINTQTAETKHFYKEGGLKIWKGKRGVTQEAATEFKLRTEQLIEALANLSNFEAQKRGDNSRLIASDVRLAYLTMIDNRIDEIDKEAYTGGEEMGDWNAE